MKHLYIQNRLSLDSEFKYYNITLPKEIYVSRILEKF